VEHLVEEPVVGLAVLIDEDGGVGRDEVGEGFGELAGFDGVAGGALLAGVGFGAAGLGAVGAADGGALFGGEFGHASVSSG
jgi:hypothetical protein